MNKEQYIPPRVEVIEVRCEAGFQASVEGWGGNHDLGEGLNGNLDETSAVTDFPSSGEEGWPTAGVVAADIHC